MLNSYTVLNCKPAINWTQIAINAIFRPLEIKKNPINWHIDDATVIVVLLREYCKDLEYRFYHHLSKFDRSVFQSQILIFLAFIYFCYCPKHCFRLIELNSSRILIGKAADITFHPLTPVV